MVWYMPCSKTLTYDIVQSYIPHEINIISYYIPIIPWMKETLDQLAGSLSHKNLYSASLFSMLNQQDFLHPQNGQIPVKKYQHEDG